MGKVDNLATETEEQIRPIQPKFKTKRLYLGLETTVDCYEVQVFVTFGQKNRNTDETQEVGQVQKRYVGHYKKGQVKDPVFQIIEQPYNMSEGYMAKYLHVKDEMKKVLDDSARAIKFVRSTDMLHNLRV